MTIYKAVVQTVLLYGSENWVVTGVTLTVLEGFHRRVARQIAGKTDRNSGEIGWEWPEVEKYLRVSGMCTIKKCIQRKQSTIAEHISNRPT